MKRPSDRCPNCGRRRTRSHAANARYWLIMHLLADNLRPGGASYSAEQWHLYCKSRWLGCDDVRLPNGKVVTVPKPSSTLTVDEFGDYAMKVEAWAAERGVFLDSLEDAA